MRRFCQLRRERKRSINCNEQHFEYVRKAVVRQEFIINTAKAQCRVQYRATANPGISRIEQRNRQSSQTLPRDKQTRIRKKKPNAVNRCVILDESQYLSLQDTRNHARLLPKGRTERPGIKSFAATAMTPNASLQKKTLTSTMKRTGTQGTDISIHISSDSIVGTNRDKYASQFWHYAKQH